MGVTISVRIGLTLDCGVLCRPSTLAAAYGQRWAEVPLEALLTVGTAGDALTRAWPALVAGQREGVKTLLRLAQQRYAPNGIGDAIVLEPLVSLAYCGDDDLGQHDKYDGGTGEQVRDLLLAWMRGLVVSNEELVPLRQQVRDIVLARNRPREDEWTGDEWAVEALAMLGPDLNEDAESYLLGLADAGGGHLSPAVESAGAARAMAQANPGLLLTLAERFYIMNLGRPGSMRAFLGGIRSHEVAVRGLGRPLAAWYYGPFWALLNWRPVEALGLVNRILGHAALARASDTWQAADEPIEVPGIELNLPGVGTQWCVGDDQAWRWYRGGSTAPYPCVSSPGSRTIRRPPPGHRGARCRRRGAATARRMPEPCHARPRSRSSGPPPGSRW